MNRVAKDSLFDTLADVGRALASGRRLEILDVLAQGERSVEEIAGELDQSVANTSAHLRALARVGLLRTRRAGTRVYYRLAGESVERLWETVREVAAAHLAGFAGAAEAYLGERAAVETVSRSEAARLLPRQRVLLWDVRPAAEFRAGHVPGARNVPPEDLPSRLRAVDAEAEVIAYCRGHYCAYADEAVRLLRRRGVRARRLEDGFPEWRREGFPVAVGGE